MGPGGARGSLTGLANSLVGDAAGVDDRDICTPTRRPLDVSVTKETLANLVRIRVRDLAPEEADGKGRHGSGMLLGLRRFEP